MLFGTIRHNPNALFGICCLAYIANGLMGVLPSSSLALLAHNTHVSLSTAGLTFTGSAFGTILAVILSSCYLVKATNSKLIIILGLAGLIATSLIIPITSSFMLWFIAQILQGASGTFISVGLVMTLTYNFGDRLSEKLNLLHSSSGVGSLFGPVLLSFTLSLTHSLLTAFTVVTLVSLICLLSLYTLRFVSKTPTAQSTETSDHLPHKAGVNPMHLIKNALFWFMALQICLYVGAESGFSNWLVTSISQSASIALPMATPAATLFWVGITLGRFIVAQLIKRGYVTGVRLLYVCIAGGCLSGLLVTAFLCNPSLCFIGSLLEGIFIGPIYPSLQSIATRRFSRTPALISCLVLVSTGLAGMTIPFSMGMLIPFLGTRGSMVIPALLCLCVAIPFALANKSERHILIHRRSNIHIEPVSTPVQDLPTRELPSLQALV